MDAADKTKRKKKTKATSKRKQTINRCLLWTLIISFVLILITIIWGYNAAKKPFESETPVTVIIPEHSTDETICDSLVTKLGDYGKTVYRLWSFRGGNPEKAAGIYTVAKGDLAMHIASRLLYGRSSTVRVTFNNIRQLNQLADKIANYFPWSSRSFLDACDSVLPKANFTADQYVAAFLPDTYEFYANADPKEVVNTLLAYRNKFWNEERRQKAQRLGLTPVEVSILTSIVEEESTSRNEHPVIAGLYLNRLKKGMRLQADPTIKFALGDFGIRRLNENQTRVESPYNTYRVYGLPPGPIRIVEGRSIDSVLNASKHNYIYMCAKPGGKGAHNFSSDYDTHLRNARAYHIWLDSLNIKR